MAIAGKIAISTRIHSRSVMLTWGRRGAANRCLTAIAPPSPRLASSLVIGDISKQYLADDPTEDHSFRLRPARPELARKSVSQLEDSLGLMNMALTFKLADNFSK